MLFTAISVLRVAAVGRGEATTVLFVLPISLLAVAFGRWGGWIGAALGVVLFVVLTSMGGTEDLDVTGWATRVMAMCLLGGLLGHAVDRTRGFQRRALDEQRRRLELEEAGRRERQALEINDSIIQGMVGAKWLAEQGEAEGAADLLDRTIDQGQRLVTELLTQGGNDVDPRVVRSGGPGTAAHPAAAPHPGTAAHPAAAPHPGTAP